MSPTSYALMVCYSVMFASAMTFSVRPGAPAAAAPWWVTAGLAVVGLMGCFLLAIIATDADFRPRAEPPAGRHP